MNVIVRSGDTLSKIAARYGVSVKDIAAANTIANVNRIRVGQVLVIPEGRLEYVTANAPSYGSASLVPGVAAVTPAGTPGVKPTGGASLLSQFLTTVPQVVSQVETARYQRQMNNINLERLRQGRDALTKDELMNGADESSGLFDTSSSGKTDWKKWAVIGGGGLLLLTLFSPPNPPSKSYR